MRLGGGRVPHQLHSLGADGVDARKPQGLTQTLTLMGPSGSIEIANHAIVDLVNRLHFNPTRGRIWLEDRRMVLLQAQTFSALREELINSVGNRVARRVTTRLGYLAGAADARLAQRLCQRADLVDALATGMQFHSLIGIVVVELVELRLDTQSGSFYGEFLWRDCAEDETNLATYGTSSEPACWMQIGYASGYLSTFVGKLIVAREVECRAMGQAVCRVVCKPAHEWDNVQDDLSCMIEGRTDTTPIHIANQARARDLVPPFSASTHNPDSPYGSSGSTNADVTLIGSSAAYSAVMHKVAKAAPTRVTVFLQGESGVGKSLLARELHRLGERSNGPFVEINCAAIPDQLLEAELFGVEKGAYTGATESRAGRFEMAAGGTIFLDEIVTLGPGSQAKLLRVLQNREVERLGSNKTIRVDVRVVAATNDDLTKAVKEGRFRADLYYRLNVLPIMVPSLRERPDDIPILIEHFLRKFSSAHGRAINGITSRALRALLNYRWPGNIRELENVIERGVVLAEHNDTLDVCHLFTLDESFDSGELLGLNHFGIPSQIGVSADQGICESSATDLSQPCFEKLAKQLLENGRGGLFDVEDTMVRMAMDSAQGNVSRAARLLKITRGQLDYRLKHRQSSGQ
jgi:two-component system, NtrC family, response regulator HydG